MSQVKTDKQSSKSDPTESPLKQGDDRNLVDVDAHFEEADFDEKVWLFWKNNKGYVILLIIIGLGVLVFIQGSKVVEANQQAVRAETYNSNLDDLSVFIEEYPDAKISGLVLLDMADEKYKAKEYAAAASKYEEAIATLEKSSTIVPERAKIGMGVSYVQSGNIEAGREALKSVAVDAAALASFRAEAMYHLAVIDASEGKTDSAHANLDSINDLEDLSFTSLWRGKASFLKNTLPAATVIEPVVEEAVVVEESKASE